MDKTLIIGANGQIGSILTQTLRSLYGESQVVASDLSKPSEERGPFEHLDVLDKNKLSAIIQKHKIDQIYHLAAILSATGEANPLKAWEINTTGLLNVLEASRSLGVKKIFFPSSIAVFGDNIPKDNTPQDAALVPETVYGISKAVGENWCNYYFRKFNMDIRSIRYPGIIGHGALPGGGTTDYAVDIYHKAVKGEKFECFLSKNTLLPMMYMPDAIQATIKIMESKAQDIEIRTGYNIVGFSFSPLEIYNSIKAHIPEFKIEYQPDFRQEIADSWPNTIDDARARKDWGWKPKYNLDQMTAEMIEQLTKQYAVKQSS